MGKRSEFERIDKDFYRTIDPRAVQALLPHLPSKTKFAEPCVGQGDLKRELEKYGHLCIQESDIQGNPSKDGLTLTEQELHDSEFIITNPPWSRPILHEMIVHFSNLKPTWLLFDADWMHTKQASEFISTRCTHIVSVGRLIWIPGTKIQGKDNCCWYLFDNPDWKEEPTEFYGR